MRLDRGAGGGGIAGLQAIVDGAMLIQQHVARHAVLEHHLPIVEHALDAADRYIDRIMCSMTTLWLASMIAM